MSVVELPAQIVEGDAVAVTTIELFTNTVTDAVAEHPFRKPVTEYVVVADGLTTMLALVCPVLHTNVSAPLATSVDDPFTQITEGDAEALTLTEPLTDTVTKAVAEQPFNVPVTE